MLPDKFFNNILSLIFSKKGVWLDPNYIMANTIYAREIDSGDRKAYVLITKNGLWIYIDNEKIEVEGINDCNCECG